MLGKELMPGPSCAGHVGAVGTRSRPCSWALSGALGPVQDWVTPAALLCSPCRSSRVSLMFASHTMIFIGNVSARRWPRSPGFPARSPGCGDGLSLAPLSPAALCPPHPPAALLRVGGRNVINRFGDPPWSLVAAHCHAHGQWGCCFPLILPAGLISTNIYEKMGLEEGSSTVGLGGSTRRARRGSPCHPCLGFPAKETLAGLARREGKASPL